MEDQLLHFAVPGDAHEMDLSLLFVAFTCYILLKISSLFQVVHVGHHPSQNYLGIRYSAGTAFPGDAHMRWIVCCILLKTAAICLCFPTL